MAFEPSPFRIPNNCESWQEVVGRVQLAILTTPELSEGWKVEHGCIRHRNFFIAPGSHVDPRRAVIHKVGFNYRVYRWDARDIRLADGALMAMKFNAATFDDYWWGGYWKSPGVGMDDARYEAEMSWPRWEKVWASKLEATVRPSDAGRGVQLGMCGVADG